MPRPQSSTPQLFEMQVRSLTPRRCSAAIRFSGIPQSPNPPTTSVAPSATSATASSAEGTTLSIMAADHTVCRSYAGCVATKSVIVSAVRTPFGKLGGGLASYEAPQLGSFVIRAALERIGLGPTEVEYVIMGHVLQAGSGQAPARQAEIGAGIPIEIPADTINKVCASSIRAVQMADQ